MLEYFDGTFYYILLNFKKGGRFSCMVSAQQLFMMPKRFYTCVKVILYPLYMLRHSCVCTHVSQRSTIRYDTYDDK